MKEKLIKLAGKMIALGHGRRRGKRDRWHGVIQADGRLYSVSVVWPDGADVPQVKADVKEIYDSKRHILTLEEIERK